LDDPEIQQLIERTPHVSLEEILENPRFPEARKLYLDRFLEVYGHDPFLVRLLIESGRFLVYHLAVVLDAGQDPARRETWFTVGRLKQQSPRPDWARAPVRSTISSPACARSASWTWCRRTRTDACAS
jgi:hypothetical protein